MEVAVKAFDEHFEEKAIAQAIRDSFDEKFMPTWNCVVGRNFASMVTHNSKNFIYFFFGQNAVLLFKSG